MPMIRVEMFPGRTAEQKRALAKALTEAFVTHGKTTPEAVSIIFVDVAKEDWATGGVLASDRQ
ncbi:4-oxalocrotonate tautomerase [Roseomonas sp. USHLN139]|uniref:4-oxalocrotonate tautomerase n=1 Tax=Roseomonas sp. USHLN139 TaxID=3081298 RepID=UPI003B028D48